MKPTLFAAIFAAALGAGPALAQHEHHGAQAAEGSMLAASTPADGAVLDAAPRALALTFAHPVLLQTVSIVGPGDAPVRASFRRAAAPTMNYQIALPADLAVGEYVASWNASGGGHAMQGTLRFTVR